MRKKSLKIGYPVISLDKESLEAASGINETKKEHMCGLSNKDLVDAFSITQVHKLDMDTHMILHHK